MRDCPKCNIRVLDDEAKFCIECGANLELQTKDSLQGISSGDTVKVKKGQKVALPEKDKAVSKIVVEIGWKKDELHKDFEIDAAIFLLDSKGKLREDSDFVFYSNPKHVSGAVEYIGKFLIDDIEVERINVDLAKVSDAVLKIAFTCTIYDADARKQNFGQVEGLSIRIIDDSDSAVLISYIQDSNFSIETALVMGELYRHKGKWKFNTILSGFKGGLPALCKNFGVKV